MSERGFRFGIADFDPGEVRDAPNLFQGERHGYEIGKVLKPRAI